MNSGTGSFLEILTFCTPRDNFGKLKPAQGIIIILLQVNFFEINGNKYSIDILRSQIFVHDLPGGAGVHKIHPIYNRVGFWVRNLGNKLIFYLLVIFPKDIEGQPSVFIVFNKLFNFGKFHITFVCHKYCFVCIVKPVFENTLGFGEVSYFFDFSNHLLLWG